MAADKKARFFITATFRHFARLHLHCESKATIMAKTIIERMCSIAQKMSPGNRDFQMGISKMSKAKEDINALAKELDLSPIQIVILTAIVRRSSRLRIESQDLADLLDVDYLKFLTYHQELEGLRKRGYIRLDKDGDIIIPKSVIDSLVDNNPVKPDPMTGLEAGDLLFRIKRTLAIRSDGQCSTRDVYKELQVLVEQNPDNSVSRSVRKINNQVSFLEIIVLYGLIYRYYYEDDDMVGWNDLDYYFTENELDSLRSLYRRERMALQRKGIIEYSGQNGLINKDYFRLSKNVKEELFADVGGVRKEIQSVTATRKMQSNEITPKTMFYNPDERRQVSRLKELMSDKRFDDIRAKMKIKNLRTGFTCLFYGGPGTGKTESVYQIARESGRNLFIVDVSKIKSCWVGESEKNIKEVFDEYRQAVNAGGTVPILLFNEADAVFGIRQQGAERAVDKMENSLQNIILQEMEDLDGILIATTNLTANLDKAFERRFLYKVHFGKPSVEARTAIWRSMIPELSEDEAKQLAIDFDFSGGQIENVSRKRAIAAILETVEPGYTDIRSYCDEETLTGSESKRKIGF